jgi:hypothetical protein
MHGGLDGSGEDYPFHSVHSPTSELSALSLSVDSLYAQLSRLSPAVMNDDVELAVCVSVGSQLDSWSLSRDAAGAL